MTKILQELFYPCLAKSAAAAFAAGFFGMLFCFAPPSFSPTAFGAERPNIVLLISDDQDYEHFGFMGHAIARTPNIDQLAREGAVFTTAHLPMSRCHPTLASLLSGRYPHQSGIYYNFGSRPLRCENALPELLKQAGYATYCEGKYWEGDPRQLGFTHGRGKTAKTFVRQDQNELFGFLDDIGETPFFIWWAPMLPHTPHNPPQRLLDKFQPKKFPIPDYIADENRQQFLKKEHRSYAMEAWLDEGVGALVEKITRLGKLDNTLFVFLVDNGWCNGLVSKGSPREKGVRTPVIFKWPSTIKPQSTDGLISTLDVSATILAYAGVEIPSEYAGRSLRPMLEHGQDLSRDALFEAIYPAFATKNDERPERDIYALSVRTRRWKYTLYLQDVRRSGNGKYFRIQSIATDYLNRDQGQEELFDLVDDPHELHDLAAQPNQKTRLSDLRRQVLQWWKATGGGPLNLAESR